MSAKIVTLGEMLLRLSTRGHERFIQAGCFDANYGGCEANVAVSLSNFGYDTEFVTAVPDNEIGESALASIRKYNVSTKYCVRSGERLGIYYLEPGSSVRPSKVIYDRAHSSVSTISAAAFDLDEIFSGADWFHFSGITPALSDSAAELTEEFLKTAKKHGLTVSCDINYRSKLWTPEKAAKVMSGLLPYTDICIGTEPAFDFKPVSEELTQEQYKEILKGICEKYCLKYAASSLRRSSSASDNDWAACIYSSLTDEFFVSDEYHLSPMVDRVGGGDAFTAGLICGLLDGKNVDAALKFGAAAAALKHTIPGDMNLVSRQEVEFLCGGGASGRVQR